MSVSLKRAKSKLPLPPHLDILGVRFRIDVVDDVDDEGSCGEMDGEMRRIRISASQDTRRQWTTLIHEATHAALHVIGLGNALDDMVEEMVAQTIEHVVEQLLRQVGSQMLSAIESEEVE